MEGRYDAMRGGMRITYYCALSERSALAVQTSRDAGPFNVRHIGGGVAAWEDAGGKLKRPAAARRRPTR